MKFSKFSEKCLLIVFIVSCCTTLDFGQIDWQKYAGNPIFNIGAAGSWDDHRAGITSVIKSNNLYEAWYSGTDETGIGEIGYATSSDGINWNKYQNNPVLGPGNSGEWDANNLDYACVLKINGEYKMWYKAEDDNSSRIGYATSSDGIAWQKYNGNPVLNLGSQGEWDQNEVLHPSVVYDGNVYHMWYNGCKENIQQTGYATSPDGITWTKFTGNPVLTTGINGTWDDYILVLMSVIYKDNEFKMWYTAGDGTDEDVKYFRVGYATSPDGITWHKYGNNPVLNIGAPGTWDYFNVAVSSVMYDTTENIYKMWYGGMDSISIRTGYATSNPATEVNNNVSKQQPESFKLMQNFPNPFNPTTKIEYEIPRILNHSNGEIMIQLKIYDMLGNELTTLVNKEQTAGYYAVEFDGSKYSSGIYFYRLVAGSFTATKKLVLIK